jgi:phosphonate transport system permease protein
VTSSPRDPADFFRRRDLRRAVIAAIVLALAIGSAALTAFDTAKAFTAIPRVIAWAAENLVPDARAMRRLPRILDTLWDTVLMSIAASVVAAITAFPFALAGSRVANLASPIAALSRLVASINRNIPVAAWALIFLLSFGQSDFTGFLALFFGSFGFMTRVFMETIDETSAGSVEALRATGADFAHVVTHAVIPAALPQMISWELFLIETNIRSATLVGLLTGSGIGFLFDVYYKSLQYSSAALIVIALVIVVLAIEALSTVIRRAIL